MNQARRIIEKCGGGDFKRGVAVVAEITRVHVSRIHRWTYPKDRGGTGGTIPSNHQQEILIAARERGVDLSPADFFDSPDNDQPSRDGAPLESGTAP